MEYYMAASHAIDLFKSLTEANTYNHIKNSYRVEKAEKEAIKELKKTATMMDCCVIELDRIGSSYKEAMPDVSLNTPDTNTITAKFIDDKYSWSLQTFGPEQGSVGVINHIRKECDEVERASYDASEWADIILLAFDGASRNGISGAEIIKAIKDKQTVNQSRQWPDWREANPDQAIEHIEDSLDTLMDELMTPQGDRGQS